MFALNYVQLCKKYNTLLSFRCPISEIEFTMEEDSDWSSTSSDIEEKAAHIIDVRKKFPNDLALFQLEEIHSNFDLKKELCRLGPCQPNEGDLENGFPVTKYQTKSNGHGNLHKSKIGTKRDWLVYFPRSNRILCCWCTLFVPEGAHNSEQLEKRVGKIRHHKNSDIHKTAAFQYSCFISGNDIDHSLSESSNLAEKERREQVEKNRKVISTLCISN